MTLERLREQVERETKRGTYGTALCRVSLDDARSLLAVAEAAREHIYAIEHPRPGGVAETIFALAAAVRGTEGE